MRNLSSEYCWILLGKSAFVEVPFFLVYGQFRHDGQSRSRVGLCLDHWQPPGALLRTLVALPWQIDPRDAWFGQTAFIDGSEPLTGLTATMPQQPAAGLCVPRISSAALASRVASSVLLP